MKLRSPVACGWGPHHNTNECNPIQKQGHHLHNQLSLDQDDWCSCGKRTDVVQTPGIRQGCHMMEMLSLEAKECRRSLTTSRSEEQEREVWSCSHWCNKILGRATGGRKGLCWPTVQETGSVRMGKVQQPDCEVPAHIALSREMKECWHLVCLLFCSWKLPSMGFRSSIKTL